MTSCFRREDALNPEIYGAAVQAVLSEYPRDVVKYVTDPRTGLASRLKWLPSIAEIHNACRETLDRLTADSRRLADLNAQFALRKKYEAELARKATNPTLAEIEAKLGRKIEPARP